MDEREVIQIAPDDRGRLYALADDGTVWLHDKYWVKMPPLPTPEQEAAKAARAQKDNDAKR